jgi:hypothetical protein
MKRIKKMAGGALTDSSGNTVRSSDGEEVSYGEPRSNSRPDIDESLYDLREKASTGYGGMGSRKAAEPRARKEEAKSEEPAKAAQPKFGTAFAEARKAGLKTFEHNGKRYTTQRMMLLRRHQKLREKSRQLKLKYLAQRNLSVDSPSLVMLSMDGKVLAMLVSLPLVSVSKVLMSLEKWANRLRKSFQYLRTCGSRERQWERTIPP